MAIRLNFPYHTRCVCSTLKEDEAQVRLAMLDQKFCYLIFLCQDLALLGNDGEENFDETPAKIKIQRKRGNRRPRVKQTYYMKF